jgi:hypothetical protein
LLPVFNRRIAPIVRVLLGDPSGPVLADPRFLNENEVEMAFVREGEGDIVSCSSFAYIDLHNLQRSCPRAMPVIVVVYH